MSASVLVCHYIKHGMTCDLSGFVGSILILGAICAILLYVGAVVRWVFATPPRERPQPIDHKGAG